MTDKSTPRLKKEKQSKELKPKTKGKSFLLHYVDVFFEFCYNIFFLGFLGRIFTSYSKEENALENGFLYHFLLKSKRRRRFLKRIREFFSRGFSNSFFIRKIGLRLKSFTNIPLKSYGKLIFSFGIFTILAWIAEIFMTSSWEDVNFSNIYVGIVVCIVSIPLWFSKETLAMGIYNGKITNFIFVKIFGYKDKLFSENASFSHNSINFLMFLSFVLGFLTIFVNPIVIIGVVVTVIIIALIMIMPEIGVLISLFFLPFFSLSSFPSLLLALLILITSLSFIIKVIRGKRYWKFKLIDVFVVFFFVLMYFSGAITTGGYPSFYSMILSCSLMFVYFLITNLMRSDVWIRRCVFALFSSAVFVAIIGIAQYITGHLEIGTFDTNYFSNIKGRVVSLFENSNVLGNYLALILPISLAVLVLSKGKYFKLFSFISVISIVICNILTWSRSAWIAMLISALIFLFIYNRKTGRVFFFTALVLPFASFLIPDSIISRFLSIGNIADSSTMYRIYTWKGSVRAISEYFWSGIGHGLDSFKQVYPQFAYAGIEAAEHSHNLFLQILLSMGIIGLIVFCIIVFFTFQQNLEYIKNTKDGIDKLFVAAIMSSLVAAIIMGMFDYIWFNYRIFFIFWCIIGLTSAYFRTDKDEKIRKQMISNENAKSADTEFSI